MKKNIPHALELDCSYEIIGKQSVPKVVLKTSKLEGYITMGEGKTKVTIPMRSWLATLLTRFQYILSGTVNGITRIAKASWGTSASSGSLASIQAGILVGTGDSDVQVGQTDLVTLQNYASVCRYGNTTLTKTSTTFGTNIKYTTKISRLISNVTESAFRFYEFGIKTRPVTPATAAPILISRDVSKEGWQIDGLGSTRIEISMVAYTPASTGGIMPNFLKIFYNLFLAGSASAEAYALRAGVVGSEYAYTAAASDGPFIVDGGSQKYYGIVAGYYDAPQYTGGDATDSAASTDENTPDIDSESRGTSAELFEYSSELTYGANTVSSVVSSANTVSSFYVSRDITNNGTTSRKINRLGLLTKGSTADVSHTAYKDDSMYLALNKPSGNENIILSPGQTLRVTYTFRITTDR